MKSVHSCLNVDPKTKKFIAVSIGAAGVFLAGMPVLAAIDTLSSTASGTASWGTSTNWFDNSGPVATDDVVFDRSHSSTATSVALNAARAANSVRFGSANGTALGAFSLAAGGSTPRILTLGTVGQSLAGHIIVDSSVTGTQSLGTAAAVLTVQLKAGLTNFAVTNSSASQLLDIRAVLAETTAGSNATFNSSGGVIQLTGVNTYTGTTSVTGGSITVTGSLANNGSNKVFVATNGSVFNASTPVITRAVANAATFAGLGSSATGGSSLGSKADILEGSNTSGTGANISMKWRTRTLDESTAGNPVTGGGGRHLASDVLDVTGIAGAPTLYTLEMSYDPSDFASDAAEIAAAQQGFLYLGWLNISNLWINAGDTTAYALPDINGYNTGTDFELGKWGINASTNTVWAVVNHNSQFAAVVPEPASLGLLVCGGLVLLAQRRRREA